METGLAAAVDPGIWGFWSGLPRLFNDNQLAGTLIIEFISLLILSPLTARVVIWQNNHRWKKIRLEIGLYLIDLYLYWLRMATLRLENVPEIHKQAAAYRWSSARAEANLADPGIGLNTVVSEADAFEYLFDNYESVPFLRFDRVLRDYEAGNRGYRQSLDDILDKMRSCVDDFEFALSPEIFHAINQISLRLDDLGIVPQPKPAANQPEAAILQRGDYAPMAARPMRLFHAQYRFNEALGSYSAGLSGGEVHAPLYKVHLRVFALIGPAPMADFRQLLRVLGVPGQARRRATGEFVRIRTAFHEALVAKQAAVSETAENLDRVMQMHEDERLKVPAGYLDGQTAAHPKTGRKASGQSKATRSGRPRQRPATSRP